ncbi:Ribosomal L7Ae domain containing protein [Trichuris trichiura]|uniref:Ribosomal L7Ae domain containing protein n=1 Tax=Trichuris trichiura TaxID=36087 RepID=A0A077YXY4_TRITR|nr:Ribosomal L7Ae domain containing protein [Trichuris trichiura]
MDALETFLNEETTSDGAATRPSDFTSHQLCALVNEIASPLAAGKLAKKLYKLPRKSSEQGKNYCIYGITAVQKAIRKGATGLCVMAGNVSPIDIYCHIPAVCEIKGTHYVHIPCHGAPTRGPI